MDLGNSSSRRRMNEMLHSLSSATLQPRTTHLSPTLYGSPWPLYTAAGEPSANPFGYEDNIILPSQEAAIIPQPPSNDVISAYASITTATPPHPPPRAQPTATPQQPPPGSSSRNRWLNPLLPASSPVKMMRNSLPKQTKITDEAKDVLQNSVSHFISFVSGEANHHCLTHHRKVINADDLNWALNRLGFLDYLGIVDSFVHLNNNHDDPKSPNPRNNKKRRLALIGPAHDPQVGPGPDFTAWNDPLAHQPVVLESAPPTTNFVDPPAGNVGSSSGYLSLYDLALSMGVDPMSLMEAFPGLEGMPTPSCGSTSPGGDMEESNIVGGPTGDVDVAAAPPFPYYTSLLCSQEETLPEDDFYYYGGYNF